MCWLAPSIVIGQPADTDPGEPPLATPVPTEPAPTPAPIPAPTPAPIPASTPTQPPPAAPSASAGSDAAELSAIAVVPVPGHGSSLETVPHNVARIDRAVLDEEHPLGLHDAINMRLGSVTLNDVQSNPLQPDVQYRGFTASPLLGSPQGLAVYQNGVRVNDAFGDIVQWDLIPEFAVHEVQLVAGANPLYGLNALGGGLWLQMKDGFRFSGQRVVALTGSFGRHQASAEWGQASGDWAAYAGASTFGEKGFRDESRSSADQAYADLRERGSDHEVGVNVTLANTNLRGNGPLPIELLEQNRSVIFTFPDITRNRLLMVAADGRKDLGDHTELRATAYFRSLARKTANGDEGEFDSCDNGAGVQVLCDDDAVALQTETGAPIPATPPFNGVFNTTQTATDGFGGALQAVFGQDLWGRTNQGVLGAAYDGSSSTFLQRVELGHLTPDRSVASEGIFVGSDGYRTKLDVDTHQAGVFVSDTYTPLSVVSIELSARLQWARIELRDRAGVALNGNHSFVRLDPAVGVTYHPGKELTLFASYSESNRAPSAIELACADPEQPCRVPNAFIADPPLEQVVTRAAEVGARGQLGGSRARPALSWSLAAFGSRNFDDIIFVAGSRIGTGFFQNAGQTQRVGVELGVSAQTGLLRAYASYSLLRATFESQLQLPGAANPGLAANAEQAAGGGEEDDEAEMGQVLDVEKGDRIPGLPTHSLKAGITLLPLPGLELGLSAIVQSSRPFRGDEANLIADVDGYAILNAQVSYWLFPALQLFIKAENLLDTRYETFGLLADPGDVVQGLSDPRFLGPGAPFGIWAGFALRNR